MTCPFCGLDPYEYVDVGIGSVPVAVNCCEDQVRLYYGEDFDDIAREWMERARSAIWRYENALRQISWNIGNLDTAGLRKIADEALNDLDDEDSPF